VAKRLLEDWTQGFEDLQQLFTLQRGKLTIAAMPSYASNCLPSILAQYSRRFANIRVTVQDVVMEEVISAVRSGRVELGITFKPDSLDGVDFEPLFKDRFIAILPAVHPLLSRPNLTFKDLLSDTLVALNRGSSTRDWTEQAIARARVEPARIFDAFQLTTVGSMVAAGVGVAVVPALCAEQMQNLGAVCRPLRGPGIEREVGLFTRRRHPLSTAAQQMIGLLRRV
jgi:LysR family carnitine catabolism transcriptional activator